MKRALLFGLISLVVGAVGDGAAATGDAEGPAVFDGAGTATQLDWSAGEVPAVGAAKAVAAPAGKRKKRSTLALIQIDGLGYRNLLRAVRGGEAPNLARLLGAGGYRASPYLNGLPTVTMAVMVQVFYGKRIPGNEWFSKAQDKPVVANDYERTLPGHAGLLHGGEVHLSELSGGGTGTNVNRIFMEETEQHGKIEAVLGQVAGAYPLFVRYRLRHGLPPGWITGQVLSDKAKLARDFQKAGFTTEKDKKAPLFLALIDRVFSPVALEGVRRAIRNRAPVVFADFSSVDERAHYYGTDAPEVAEAMRRIDSAIGEIARAAKEHGARLVIFSDHGQTKTDNFIRRFGKRPQEWVDELARASNPAARPGELVFAHVYSLGNIYVRNTAGHLDAAELERRYPGLLRRLADHPGVGMVAVRDGPGVRLLGKAADPIAQYADALASPVALRAQVERYLAIDESGDIVIFAPYDGERTLDYNENYTLASQHGGLGGDQMHPFLMWDPAAVGLDPAALADAQGLNAVFQALIER
ncbi:MAG: alkaline phosphatase family protein [Elusimicrobia bacterium]|nr:alkaline phosphatase family protein [Elusimicrobiota bacterium]